MPMIYRIFSVIIVALLVTACNSYPNNKRAWLSDWVDASAGVVSPSNSIEVAPAKIARLAPEDEAIAEQWLLQLGQHSALLSEMPNAIPFSRLTGLRRDSGEDVYLVRSASDGGNGVFSAHVNESGVLVLYNVMGDCGALERRVLAVSLGSKPERVYGGCSGSM